MIFLRKAEMIRKNFDITLATYGSYGCSVTNRTRIYFSRISVSSYRLIFFPERFVARARTLFSYFSFSSFLDCMVRVRVSSMVRVSVSFNFFIAFSALRCRPMLKDRKLTRGSAALVAQLLQSWHFTTLVRVRLPVCASIFVRFFQVFFLSLL